MAKVFKVQGVGHRVGPFTELPWQTCRHLLQIDHGCRTQDRPERGEITPAFATRIIVRLHVDEARRHGVTPGYFVSPLKARVAIGKLDAFQGRRAAGD